MSPMPSGQTEIVGILEKHYNAGFDVGFNLGYKRAWLQCGVSLTPIIVLLLCLL